MCRMRCPPLIADVNENSVDMSSIKETTSFSSFLSILTTAPSENKCRTMVLKACAILLTVIVTLVPLCESFVLNENNRWIVLPRRQTHSPIKKKFFPLFGMLDSSSGTNDKEDDDDNDVEVQRQRLAALFGGGPSTSSGSITENTPSVSSSSVLPPDWEYQLENPPPLTAIGRERAVAEIELLQKLKDNDEPMEELWQLWYNSRGPETAKKITSH